MFIPGIEKILTSRIKSYLFILGILILVNTVLELFSLISIIPLLKVIIDGSIGTNFPYFNDLFIFSGNLFKNNFSIINNETNALVVGAVFIFLFLFILKTFFYILVNYFTLWITARINLDISNNLFSKYLKMEYSRYLKHPTSFFKNNLLQETQNLVSVFQSILYIITESFIIFGICCFLIYYYGLPVIFIFLALTLISIAIYLSTKRKLEDIGLTRLRHAQNKVKILDEILIIIKDLFITKRFQIFLKNFNQNESKFLNSLMWRGFIQTLLRPIFELVGIITLCSFIIFLIIQNSQLNNLIISLGFISAAAYRLLPSITKILTFTQVIKFNWQTSINLISEINKKIPVKKNKYNAAFSFNKKISLKKLNFKYENSKSKIISNLDLEIKKGDKIGIYGPSGSGKTTLLNILLNLLKPQKGTYTIDKLSVPKLYDWSNKISFVPQEVPIIEDTLSKNIALGVEEKNINRKKIKVLTKLLDIQILFNKFQNKKIKEVGKNISIGQKQRIGIARALYNEPQILVLDEATSSLDTKNEKNIMKFIYQKQKKMTIIIVSHKKNIFYGCDKVFEFYNRKLKRISK